MTERDLSKMAIGPLIYNLPNWCTSAFNFSKRNICFKFFPSFPTFMPNTKSWKIPDFDIEIPNSGIDLVIGVITLHLAVSDKFPFYPRTHQVEHEQTGRCLSVDGQSLSLAMAECEVRWPVAVRGILNIFYNQRENPEQLWKFKK